MRIAVVGAGPGGLYLSVLLGLPGGGGHEVTVFERGARGSSSGYGLTLMDGFLDDFADHDPATAAAVRAAAVPWEGQVIQVAGRAPVDSPAGGHSIRRSSLVAALDQRARELGVTLRYDTPVEDEAQLAGFDLVVAADGVASALRTRRAQELGTRVERHTNLYTWLGTTKPFDTFRFVFTRSAAGWAWMAAHTFDAGASGFIVEMPERTWSGLGLDTAGAAESLAVLEGVFADQLEGHRLAPQDGARAVPWSRFARVTNERWHTGRLVLLGDAAHTTHFSTGSGTRLAMDDAVVLARVLADPALADPALADRPADGRAPDAGVLDAALEAYGRQRRAELAGPSEEALNSVLWFEGLERYVRASPRHFAMLYDRRRTSLHRRIPVPLYTALSDVAALPGVGRLARGGAALLRRVSSPAAGRASTPPA